MIAHGVTLAALTLVALTTLSGCAVHSRPKQPTPSLETSPIVVVAGSELGIDCSRLSLYEALRAVRGEPLGWRGQLEAGRRSESVPALYINGTRQMTTEPAEPLRRLACASVRKVELISSPLSFRRYGHGHEAGTIFVTTDSRPSPAGRTGNALLP